MILLLTVLSSTYTPVEGLDLPIKSEVIDTKFTNGVELRYRTSQISGPQYSKEMVSKAIYIATVDSMFEIQKLMPLEKRCEPDNFLEIYEIKESDLNDSTRFPERFVGNPSENRGPLWGYYDPRPYENKVDSIVVSNHGDRENYRIMVHEIAHYWYNTYCLDSFSTMTSEEFALRIQGQSSWP